MRIVIPGGTGQVGTLLARSFVADGHDVTVLTRHPKHAAWRVVQWDARTIGAWVSELDGADVVINLAGRNATRLVLLRSSMIMSPDAGGIFATLLRLVRFGLGGAVDGGRQYVSWIHERDFVRSLYWIMEHESLSGPVSIAAPHPLPYRDFMRDLRRAAGVPIGLPATRWMVALGTWALRTESELVLKSRRVVPRRLAESGFGFEYPEWSAAASDLVRQARGR